MIQFGSVSDTVWISQFGSAVETASGKVEFVKCVGATTNFKLSKMFR